MPGHWPGMGAPKMADTEAQPTQVRLIHTPVQPDQTVPLADEGLRPQAAEVGASVVPSRSHRGDMDSPVGAPPAGTPGAPDLASSGPGLGDVEELQADGFQVYYEPGNPYDADLHLNMPDGSIAVLALPPMDLAMLATQLEEVRTSQRRMQHELDGGNPDDFSAFSSRQPAQLDDEQIAADADELAAADRQANEGRPLPERIARKAADPYSFLSLLDMVPPIAGHSGKTVVTVAVLMALVLSAFVGIVLL